MTNIRRVLLTGAGFTHNFGTPLASEMGNIIFNDLHIQKSERLRKFFLEESDYEHIYHKVINDNSYGPEEKRIVSDAIREAYSSIDDIVQNPCYKAAIKIEGHIIKRFKSSYIFTLNQDLFVERQLHNFPDTNLILPGTTSKILKKAINGSKFKEDDVSFIDNEKIKETEWNHVSNGNNILYIKLHGSFDWRDAKNQSVMVIGRHKEETIKRHYLLQSYFDKFKQILNENKTKILIIGYGFNDQHINKILAEANNLDIYIINPTNLAKWTKKMREKDKEEKETVRENIIKKIRNYFPKTLEKIFPDNNKFNDCAEWSTINEAVFEKNDY